MNELVLSAIAVGAIATLVMDLWALLVRFAFGTPSLDYALVGRWLGHLPRGILVHKHIGKAATIPGEAAIGWVAHYLIGFTFAAILLLLTGRDWAESPTLWPALLTGWITLAAPFLVLQPGLGIGIAASKAPKPNLARWRSFMAHTAFGVGLFIGAWIVSQV